MLAQDPEFAIAVAARARELGLTYASVDGVCAIAVALPTAEEPEAAIQARAQIARAVLAALVKVGRQHRAALLEGLSPIEQAVLRADDNDAFRLVTARADMLVDDTGRPWVLEVNTTIPAMQGYSDIARRAWVETWLERSGGLPGSAARARADEVLGAQGSNADDLLNALVASYRLDGGEVAHPSIALVHRRGDSQLGELSYLAAQFQERGHPARTLVVDELVAHGPGKLAAGDFVPDMLYRHVFARLVPGDGAFAAALRAPARFHVYNPIAAHLEQKAALALLSEAADDDVSAARLGLTGEERATVRAAVPWTRILDAARIAEVASTPARYVVKRSWDFGGKSVVLGDEAKQPWPAFVAQCAEEGGWIVQERVPLRATPHLVAADGVASKRMLFSDASSYTGFGTAIATGGVRRSSTSPIVNIQSGGGVMPMISDRLLADLRRVVARGR